MKYFKKAIWLLCSLYVSSVLLFSCNDNAERKIAPAFYYWKSDFSPTNFEKDRLDSLSVNTLYIKFFDIAWDANTQKVLPIAKIALRDTSYLQNKKLIPVVFITNETFYQLDSNSVKHLAVNTSSLLKKYFKQYQLKSIEEIQIDCDWTTSTKTMYFYFLQQLKIINPQTLLSATIRLHQVKYTTSSGIPPVQRGLLMCYNMGNLQNINTKNSIIDFDEFKRYSSYISTYPLSLDVGLPLFNWYVLFRNAKYAGLMQAIPKSLLSTFKRIGVDQYEIQKDTLFEGRPLRMGDIVRYENSNYKDILHVLQQLTKRLNKQDLRIALYHCDSVILTKYSFHELQNIYRNLHYN